jgi:hypothetical protein
VNKAAVPILVVFIAGISFLAQSSAVADSSADAPEFYFTRLVYTQNSSFRDGFGFGRMYTLPKPAPYRCPEFGGGDFFPPQGWGWATDYPGADCKFMGAIHRLTGQRVYEHPNVIEIMDENLFKFPYAYIVEPGQMYLRDKEAARLREYLLRGGFLHFDDFWGLRQKANLEAELRKVFPDRPIERLPLTHEIFRTFFDIAKIIQIPNQGLGCDGGRTWEQRDDTEPRIYGISDDRGRVMVVITYNSDLGDAWEYMDLACYPHLYSGQAIRLGLNFMIYAMTH